MNDKSSTGWNRLKNRIKIILDLKCNICGESHSSNYHRQWCHICGSINHLENECDKKYSKCLKCGGNHDANIHIGEYLFA